MGKKIRKIDKLVLFFFIFLLSLYVVLKVINRLTPAGDLFSKLHIQPNNLIWPVLISLVPVAIAWIPQINFKKLFKIKSIFLLFVFSITMLNLYRIYKSNWQTFQFVIAHPRATYDDKMRQTIGSLTYNYALFVNKYTPPNASILIPPQAFPWPASGNVVYFRYFIYPRDISNGDEFEPPSKDAFSKIDYVFLDWGETDMVEFPHTHDWPKFDVKAEKIIFMNEDGSFGGEVKGDYHYKDYKNKRVWGLIVVKH